MWAWTEREVLRRGGVNIHSILEHPAEMNAFESLAAALGRSAAATAPGGQSPLAAARKYLDPEETALVVDVAGADDAAADMAIPDEAANADLESPVSLTLSANVALVLFEFLCREMDDADGRRLAKSFAYTAEYWALTAMQNVLETGDFYSALGDYMEQVGRARDAVLKASA